MSETPTRAGVLRVTYLAGERFPPEALLPRGHTIRARRDCPAEEWVEHLVEGPLMLESVGLDFGTAPAVTMLVRQQTDAAGTITRLYGSWAHLPGVEWPIAVPAQAPSDSG